MNSKSYLSFIENCHLLNSAETYPKLIERAKAIGFEISKVVFRGYFASPKLQQMHDTSIQTRTNLKLQVDYNFLLYLIKFLLNLTKN